MATYSELIGKRVESFKNDPNVNVNYTVTVASSDGGNKYFIDGVQQKQLRLYEGNTYTFDYSAASSHPFRFSTTSDGTHNSGSEYTTGVSVDSNVTTIVVASGTPNLFYYCSSHPNMGGRANTPEGSSVKTQMWYNETNSNFKTMPALEAWVSASPLLQKRTDPSGFGTQTANVCATGNIPPRTAVTEEYNGSGWSTGGTASQAGQYRAGFGTLTAGAVAGARTPAPAASNATEHYDGTSWSPGGNLPTSIYLPGNQAAGTLTAGLVFGGDTGPGSSFPTASYEYNGSTWGSGGSTNTARSFGAGSGTQTAAFFACGTTPPFSPSNDSVHFEQYDGSSWTTGPNLNTARISTAAGGDTTAGLVFGGEVRPGPAVTNKLETWDGTSWTLSPATMGTARMGSGRALGTGSNTANIASGGYTSTPVTTTEEYNKSINIITAAAWSSAPTLPESRYTNAGAGTSTAALNWGGVSPTSSTTAEYDGSSWTTGGSYPKGVASHGGTGLQTAALSVGGLNPASPPAYNDSFEYNGTSWGSPQTYPQYGFGTRVWGIQTSAIATGGGNYPAPTYNTTTANSYNGTSWSGETAFSTLRSFHTNGGANDTEGIIMGGRSAPGTETAIDNTEEYNGTSWTSGGNYLTVNKECAGWGIQTDLMQAGGSVPAATATCAIYDGTAWATTASLPTALTLNATTQGTFNTDSGFTLGGSAGGATNAVSEFTPESTAVNVKTLTQS